MIGHIRALKVDPEGDAVGQALELFDVAPDALFTRLVELGDTIFLDIRLAAEAQFLLNFQFDGQPMRIPAASGADDVLAAHAVIANDDILHHAGLNMMHARSPVGRWRPLKKDKWARGVAAL